MSKSPDSNWFLEDRAIGAPNEDAFEHVDVARQLAEVIRQFEEPATFGLIGGFGEGKSSIGNLLARDLAGHPDLQVVRISAEKHTGAARQRAMVFGLAHELQEAVGVGRSKIEGALAPLSGSEELVGFKFTEIPLVRFLRENKRGVARAAGCVLSAFAAVYLLLVAVEGLVLRRPDVNPWTWPVSTALSLSVIAGGLALMPDWFRASVRPTQVTTVRPRAEAADEIERVFADLVRTCKKRLVIVVDDIDRLSPNQVLEALSAIRTFQAVPRERPPFFVIACDDKVVQEAIADANPSIAEVDGDRERAASEYLNKMFVVRQHLPPHLSQDMQEYAAALLKERGHPVIDALGDRLDGVLGMLVHEGVDNPRHVIRLLNNFFSDYRLAAVRESKDGGRPGRAHRRCRRTRLVEHNPTASAHQRRPCGRRVARLRRTAAAWPTGRPHRHGRQRCTCHLPQATRPPRGDRGGTVAAQAEAHRPAHHLPGGRELARPS